MPTVQGPFYTLEEAADVLSLRESELLYAVETGQLKPVVVTSARAMLVVGCTADNRMIVHGTCTYRGPLRVPQWLVAELLDKGKARLGYASALAVDENGISAWSTAYPFQRQPPHKPAFVWESKPRQEFAGKVVDVTPLPGECQPLVNSFYGVMKKIADASPDFAKELAEQPGFQGITAPSTATLQLDFDINSVFGDGELRIAASDIERYRRSQSVPAGSGVASLRQRQAGSRQNQLHDLILRVLVENAGIKAKAAWRLIEEDWKAEMSIYDAEGIIQAMDASCIEWCSRGGSNNSLSWGSFQTLLPKLRKRQAAC